MCNNNQTLSGIRSGAVDRWLKTAAQATMDLDLLSSHPDLELYERQKADLLDQIADAAEGASVPNWQRALQLFEGARRDETADVDALDELGAVLKRGAAKATLVAQLNQITKEASRIRKDENKRLADLEGRITPRELRKVLLTYNDIVLKKLNETGRALGIGDDQLGLVRQSVYEEMRRTVVG